MYIQITSLAKTADHLQ